MPERRGGAAGSDDPRGRGGGGSPRREHPRRFTDERGVLWTAEVRRVGTGAPSPSSPSASTLVLFSSESRACLASLPADPPFAELTVEELRRQLRACLSG